MPLRPLPTPPDLPALEREVLQRWERDGVFAETLQASADGPTWVFYEGPPTANGLPGAHHVEARAFKDLFCRFRTMTGHHVVRKAGWDCHGLPVELAVEKELGFTSKHDIEAYGVAAFNDRCRESVLRHVGEFERMSARMGYWLDYADAYRTMDPAYVESVWWSLAELHRRGLLSEDYRVSPYCPRCQTALSDHEVSLGYTDVVDPSVYVALPVTAGPLAAAGAYLLVWTTTPWTLVSNTAVAVHPDVTYVLAAAGAGPGQPAGPFVLAEDLLSAVLGDDAEVLERFPGRALEHTHYQPPLSVLSVEDAHYVVLADYVTTVDGTGLVHQAPAFGAEDMAVARRYGLPVVNPLGADGCFAADLDLVGGQFFKAADPVITDELRARGLLWRHQPYAHSYPLCWRCDTALLYYALPSWYVRTTAVKDGLLAANADTDWHPGSIRDGRYGDWLTNNVDWALSRNRYWGTPLPLWRCSSDPTHVTAVASLADLGARAGRDVSALDPHRPFVDDVEFACPTCGATARRVPEVIDCWYDAGSMPFAQWGAPHRNPERFDPARPADFIAEAIDQTRGWFYTLMAVGVAVHGQSPYRSVLCLGHIVDEHGQKMSKHLGNVMDPMELFERHGADAVRWLMLATGNPWAARRVGHPQLEEVVRKTLLTYYNTASFLTLYADANGWQPTHEAAAPPQHVLDRWLHAEVAATAAEVRAALDAFDSVRAGRRLATLVDDLSNWYVRRSRRRFWAGDPAALDTLHRALRTVTVLLAPFLPFVTETVWAALGGGASVHLQPYPAAGPPDAPPAAGSLSAQVALARRLVELGRAARADSGVRTRQPLGRALLAGQRVGDLEPGLLAEIAEELNVTGVDLLADAAAATVDVVVKPNFRALGRRFGAGTQAVAAQVDASRYDRTARSVRVDVDGAAVTLTADELIVTETPKAGWAVASGDGLSVALDLTLTPALRRAGLVREVSRLVNEARKTTGLQVSDRIELWWEATGEAAEALAEHATALAAEVLAVAVTAGRPAAPLAAHPAAGLDLTFWLRAAGG